MNTGTPAGGSVKFLVYAENTSGKPLFESKPLPDANVRSALAHIDVTGVSKLVLVTDWGPDGAIGLYASWAAARLLP